MGMTTYQESLNILFKAEEMAKKVLADAEAKKQVIMDDALKECHNEVDVRRAEMEKEFQKTSKSNVNNFDPLIKEANQVKTINETEYRANKGEVLDILVDRLLNVKIELARNVTGDFHNQIKKNKH